MSEPRPSEVADADRTGPVAAALEAVEQDVPDLSAEMYNRFVAGMTLDSIDIVAVAGERRAPGEASLTRFDLQAGFHVQGRTVHYRFNGIADLTDEDDLDYGQVSASVVVTFTAEVEPQRECVEQFGASSAPMMAHPYLREALASTAHRIGFPGVLLPVLVHQPAS